MKKRKFEFSTTDRGGEQLHEKDEQNKVPANTTVYDLPLEMLDIILQKSFLHWILNSSTMQRDEEVIRSLISVDVCFYQRITRQRFKKTTWRYLKDFYGKTKKRSAIIRNNRNYLLRNIKPNDELIASLLSLNCITEEQSHFIQRKRSNQAKNCELLYIMKSLDEKKFSNFVKCLHRINQKTAARIIDIGGGVIKIEVQTHGEKCIKSMETLLLHEKIEDLRNRTKLRSHKTDNLISQLRQEGIEILNSQLDRETVVVWIWCHLQSALEYIKKLCESNQLRDVFFENIQPFVSKMISIDRHQFNKTIVVCPISSNFPHRFEMGTNEYVHGVTKLRNDIYALCRTVIRVFDHQNPFRLPKEIRITEIRFPVDIGSSEMENCLYVSDDGEKCVWKITREANDEHKIIKWLTTDYQTRTLSVSSNGQLLMVNDSSSSLTIYGSDAELIQSIQLPRDIEKPIHAVETSIGNFIILHMCLEEKEEGESELSRKVWIRKWDVSELTRDGQMVIRRFIPTNETQEPLNHPEYLSVDSDDQVFVADQWNDRVILLDSELKWTRILCPIEEEEEETKIEYPLRLCYVKEKKQLIVVGDLGEAVIVYPLSRN